MVEHFRRIAVLGVGLIGGSIAAAARSRALGERVVGFAPGRDGEEALALGLVDELAADPGAAVDGADLVVLAAPVPVVRGLFAAVAHRVGAETLLTDAASTKRSTIAAAREALGAAFPRFVPAHPIAGSERHGPAAARPDLFGGCTVLLCPQDETDADAYRRVAAFWEAIGARAVDMPADDHDRLFAEVSHWPHAAVFALCAGIAEGPRAEDALRFAGAGLRDTTRIGASSPGLWADIVLDNREAVLECAAAFERELRATLDAIERRDRAALVECFDAASRWRRRLR